MIGRWLVSFLSSLFPSPHQSSSLVFLKFFPLSPIITMPINLVFPTPSADFNEVWGMDNGDFYYPDSNEVVRVVKRSGMFLC